LKVTLAWLNLDPTKPPGEVSSMEGLLRNLVLLMVAVTGFAEDNAIRQAVTVLVYNYARVPEGTLDRAKQEATRIYSRIDIDTHWLGCPLSPAEASAYPACQIDLGPTVLVLRLVAVPETRGPRLDADSFGFALMPEGGGFGLVASVFAYRAGKLARGDSSFETVLLGHLMAHEMGHLLLGVGSHSVSGLMRAHWQQHELELVRQRTLAFTSGQVESIRAQAQERVLAASQR
jgi:hypothetical protein